MSDSPLVTIIVPTEGRHEFMPWLGWNLAKQTYGNIELLLVTPDDVDFRECTRELGARGRDQLAAMIDCAPGDSVPHKYNEALRRARGELIVPMSDDSWHHPERIARLVEAWLDHKPAVVGSRRAFFVRLSDLRCAEYRNNTPPASLVAVREDIAKSTLWPTDKEIASDTTWLRRVEKRDRSRTVLPDDVLSLWLCHERNLNKPRHDNMKFPRRLQDVVSEHFDREAYGMTGIKLTQLRERLGYEAL